MWPGTAGWRRSAFKCGPRDRWTRWSREWRFQRLHLIGNNTRFVLFGAPGVFPNLTSHALSRMTRRPGDDRRERWGHGLLVAEGFVDPGRFDGGMYRAAGQTACADRADASAGNTCVVHGVAVHISATVVRSFRHRGLRQLFEHNSSRLLKPDPVERVRGIVTALVLADSMEAFIRDATPGWRIHRLSGERRNEWSVSVSGNRRPTFEERDGEIKRMNLEDCH